MMFFRKKSFAGLDIGTSSVKLVQIKESKDNEFDYQIKNIQYNDKSDPTLNQLKEVMQEILTETKKMGDILSVGVHGISIFVRYIEIPQISSKEMEVALPIEAKKFIPFPLDDMSITHSILPTLSKDSRKMGVTFVGMQKSKLLKLEQFFDSFGIKVKTFETPAFSLSHAYKNTKHYLRGKTTLIINIGTKYTNLIVCRDGGVYFARDLLLGGRDLTKALMSEDASDYAKAEVKKRTTDVFSKNETFLLVKPVLDTWLKEVQDSMDYFKNYLIDSHQEINNVVLTGGGALLAGFCDYLSRKLALPVNIDGELTGRLEDMSKEKDLARVAPMLKFSYSLALKCKEDFS